MMISIVKGAMVVLAFWLILRYLETPKCNHAGYRWITIEEGVSTKHPFLAQFLMLDPYEVHYRKQIRKCGDCGREDIRFSRAKK